MILGECYRLNNGGGYYSPNSSSLNNRRRPSLRVKAIVVLLLFLFISSSLFAYSIKWTWDGDSVYYRYSSDEKSWTVTEDKEAYTDVENDREPNLLFVQSSNDKKVWSKSSIGRYSLSPITVRVNISPYTSALIDFYNAHSIEKARDLTGTVLGNSLSLDLCWDNNSSLRLYTKLGGSYVILNTPVSAKSRVVEYIKGGVGVDLYNALYRDTSFFFGLGGGVMLHIAENKMSITPYGETRLGFEWEINERVSCGVVGALSVSHFESREEIKNSLTLLYEPISATLSYRF